MNTIIRGGGRGGKTEQQTRELEMRKECVDCGHSKNWHSLTSEFYTPARSGCLANGCKCRMFVERENDNT